MNLFATLAAFGDLFRQGNAVVHRKAWKTGQVTVNTLGGLFLAAAECAKQLGHPLPLTDAQSYAIAGGVIAIANIVTTIVSSKCAGLPAKEPENELL